MDACLAVRTVTGTVDATSAALTESKTSAFIGRKGAALELLLKENDPENSGKVSVKAFSECLRASNLETDGNGDGALTRADRKVLYRKWAVHGQVCPPGGFVDSRSI